MKLTIYEASREFAVDRRTLTRGLAERGITVKPGAKYTIKQLHDAIAGDLEYEKTRLTRADADLREMDKLEKKHILVPLSEVADIVNPILLTVRQRLNNLAAECGIRCNPTDPALAEQQLNDWVARTLPMVREKLPQPEKAK